MKRWLIVLALILAAVYILTYLWARNHFPALFPA